MKTRKAYGSNGYTVILKGSSKCEAKAKPSDSWIWRKLLMVRDLFAHCITKCIGNGTSTSFWYDPWYPWGILSSSHPELIRKINLHVNAKVSAVLSGSCWNITYNRGWDSQGLAFRQECRGIVLRQGEDNGNGNQTKTSLLKVLPKPLQMMFLP